MTLTPTNPAQWHITVAFFGQRTAAEAREIKAKLRALAAATPPMELRLAGAGRFGRALWLGVAGETERLRHLMAAARRVTTAATEGTSAASGGAQPYAVPHVTVARLARATSTSGTSTAVDALEGFASEPWRAGALELAESKLSSAGARHHLVERWELAGS